jgi:hypothetical protein
MAWKFPATCPKDGTIVVLLTSDSRVVFGRCLGSAWEELDAPVWAALPDKPRHWLPIPPIPPEMPK